MSAEHPKNRLAQEASPYLQQHASNPVNWLPWGPEALELAKREDKPILLSIGYSACHWCHVMERESFEDAEIAKQMNEDFVSVKVDREERPDLDQIYQLVVQLMGRSGGWPLTVFLTPDQKPFFGGTYFPPDDKHGLPGFPKILRAISDAYRDRRDEVDTQAAELTVAIGKATAANDKTASPALGPDLLKRAAGKLSGRFDDQHGGFGARPKFPNTMGLDVLLRFGVEDKDERALSRVKRALEAMRHGGIYDHLGGGFHRYSTDAEWLVPHFEKMLYDNACLLRLYVDGFRATGEVLFADTARETAAYIAREMTDESGGFYATQDADSEGHEGKFFVWSPDEIVSALGSDDAVTKMVFAYFGVTDDGNFEDSGSTVLHEATSLAKLGIKFGLGPSAVVDALSGAKKKLFDVREKRVKPFRDEKILASWNGLMIGALAEASHTLEDEALLALAERAYAFIAKTLVTADGRVLRHVKGSIVKGPGFLDDHAFVANAALDLYEATGKPHFVADARRITDALVAHFTDGTNGGFFFTADDGEDLILRAKDPYDHALPSGASIAANVLLRLGALADATYTRLGESALELLAPVAIGNPFGMGQTICVLDRLVRGGVDVVLVGDREDPRTRALVREAYRAYLPNRTIAWFSPDDPESRVACAVLAEGKDATDVPVAYVCRERTCSLPIRDPAELRALLAAF